MSKSSLGSESELKHGQFNQADWSSAYCNVDDELNNFELKIIKGEIPIELNGTLYRNGPGKLERNGQWIHHPFDGDGMIAAFKFEDCKCNFTNKFIRTQAWLEEEKAGRFLYRGVFGTQKPGGKIANIFDIRLKNIANTNVVPFGEKLLALWEAAGPHEINPSTLETIGITNLNGILKSSEAFSAHPRYDPGHHGAPRMVNFGVNTGPKSTIRLMEFHTQGNNAGELISERKDQFPGFAFLHDFVITKNWAIFLQNSIRFNPLPFILGTKGAAQCLSSNTNDKSNFLLIPRESGVFANQMPRVIEGPKGFVFHHLNAWEEDNDLFIDSIYYNDFPSIDSNQDFRTIDFDLLPEGILTRCHIDLSNEELVTKRLNNQCCEFAMVNPQKQGSKARYAWMAISAKEEGNGPLQSIKKLDLLRGERNIWSAAPRGFVTEPLMVPHPNAKNEDEGWVISLIWNGETRKSQIIILNSADMSEQAIIELPITIPYGLHGSWVNKK